MKDQIGERLTRLLTHQLPEMADARDRAIAGGRTTLLSVDGSTRVVLVASDDVLRVTITHVETAEATLEVDRLSLAAAQRELEALRTIADGVPWLVWRETTAGRNGTVQITWANGAYLDLATDMTRQKDTWPPPCLFDTKNAREGFGDPRRMALQHTGLVASDWFTVFAKPLSDGSTIHSCQCRARGRG